MNQVVLKAVAVKDLTAAARHQNTWFLRRQPLAGLPHGIFARGPIALSAPSLKIRFRSVRQKYSPRILEFDAGLIEGGSGAARAFCRMATGIEAAGPAPRVLVMRNASADRNRADAHVTVVDVPTFVGSIGRAAAGEGGHGAIEARTVVTGNPVVTLRSQLEIMQSAANQIAAAMGIIELFEITIAFCTVWIVVSAVLRRFREGR